MQHASLHLRYSTLSMGYTGRDSQTTRVIAQLLELPATWLLKMEKEVYPNILRWKDRVVPLSWYELVLEPEKLRMYLKVLEGDLQSQ